MRLAVVLATALAAWTDDLTWHPETGYRWAEVKPAGKESPGFVLTEPSVTGVAFANMLSQERSITNRNLLSGSGVAAGDIDGDGRCDLFFCGLDHSSVLYRNLGGWKFEDVTAAAGVACPGQDSTGAVLADIDGDGDLDLLVNSLGNGLRVFLNDGKGRFREATDELGLRSHAGGMSLALADIDGNGTLDLYVVNYRTTTVMDQPRTTFRIAMVNGQPQVASVNDQPATLPQYTNRFMIARSGDVLELGEEDVLYRNDGKGHFTPVSFTGGAFLDEDGTILSEPPRDWGLSVQFHDINGDGAPDLYVCNDLYSVDRFWINDGKGRFRAIAPLAVRTTSTFSMGVDFGDLNRDGQVDFMVVDMLATGHKDRHTQVSQNRLVRTPPGLIDNRLQAWRNTLQMNRGDGTFAEASFYAGVEASNWSWMPMFLDVDLDGYEDILIPNGQTRDFQNVDMANRIDAERAKKQLTAADIMAMVKLFPDFSTPSIAFRNRGNLTFEEVGAAWGFTSKGVAQGTTVADLDNDGDLDLIANRLNEPGGLYRNEGTAPRLGVRLKGRVPNVQGIGAKIVVTGGPVTQSQEVICGGHYLSGADPMRTFAVGNLTNRLKLEVTWRTGGRTVVDGAIGNRLYEIEEPERPLPAAERPAPPPVWFVDQTERLHHGHHEEMFDDFERQPLLPRTLSQLGPGVAWQDVDGDGWEDLIVASGRGGTLGVYHNDGQGGFQPVQEPMLGKPAGRDMTAVVAVDRTVFTGSSNYEDGQTNGGCIRVVDFAHKASGESVRGFPASTGPLALADVDGDGALDLFAGGRCVPGRYPEPADSLLLRNEGGRFVLWQKFDKVGLVSAALFTDLDGDGRPELVLACEWGPLRVFQLKEGKYDEVTRAWGLDQMLGWWNSVTAGDFDGDGRMDLVAGNWGLNHAQRRTSETHPRRLYYGDFDGSGGVGLIEAYFNETMGREAPDRGYLAVKAALPFIEETAPTFEAYGTKSLAEIYGDHLASAAKVEVNTFESALLMNRGGKFERLPLPPEAQWSPVFGIGVADFDGDGHEDVFLAQNFFALPADYTRIDAGRGLLLRGDGQGGLKLVPGQESGLAVYGEQRGAAVADYDHDGRADLVVTQNGAATCLFRNLLAQPGLRVRLAGALGNPAAVGAALRLKGGGKSGPVREIHSGAGYWSTDAPVQLMCLAAAPEELWVRWPGGRTVTYRLPAGAKEVEVQAGGELKAVK